MKLSRSELIHYHHAFLFYFVHAVHRRIEVLHANEWINEEQTYDGCELSVKYEIITQLIDVYSRLINVEDGKN